MCGIVGWLSTSEAAPVEPDRLLAMREALQHRGPDGEGLWVSRDRRAGLAFRRLAIIDLSPDAGQPMASEDGRTHLVFNGEIYNHLALRRELESRGHRFRTDHSDTESILRGYMEWGEGVFDRLHGMFAVGIWDQTARHLVLARDRIGVKPLYFAWTSAGFLFASEIKALVRHPGITPELEDVAAYHYLSFLTTPAPLTMFRGIYKLPAGHRVCVDLAGTMRAERYWDALPGQGPDAAELSHLKGAARDDFANRRVLELLDDAIRVRLMSDVPFGVFLSGGIDSSANVALMSRQMSQPVRTFTVGFSDHAHLNELEWARRVARHYGADHSEVMVDEAAMKSYLPSLVHSQDEPIADWVCIPLYFVSKLARDSGTVVVQVGEGSDEQFCGYTSYMAYLEMYKRYWRPFSLLPRPLRKAMAGLAGAAMGVDDRHDLYLDAVVRAGLEREPFWSGAHVFPETRKVRILDRNALTPAKLHPDLQASGLAPPGISHPDSYEVVRAFFARLDAHRPDADILTRMTYSELKLRLPELLLMRVDKIGMSTSIEPRVPFLDHRLVEFTMSIPMQMKLAGGGAKALLKRALRGLLPDDVIDRPKMGFGAPMAQWLRGEFGREVEATLQATRFFDSFPATRQLVSEMLALHRAGRRDCSLYVWTFYNAVAWFDHWIDGDRHPS